MNLTAKYILPLLFCLPCWLVEPAVGGVWANINVQNEPEGTEFADWAGIPLVTEDAADNPGEGDGGRPFADIAGVAVANNAEFLFVRITYHTSSAIDTYVSFDTDSNVTTGFDLFQEGIIGTDFSYVNDFPFVQWPGVFNTNTSITGGPLANGGALIWPFWDQDGTQMSKELAIPLSAMVTFPASGLAFPNPSFNLIVWHEDGLGDRTAIVNYTLATPPAGLVGDYDGNGIVNAGDYTVWRDNVGADGTTLGTGRDPANTGSVGAADYASWAAAFGDATPTGSLVTASVPEPTTLALGGLIVVSILAVRFRIAR